MNIFEMIYNAACRLREVSIISILRIFTNKFFRNENVLTYNFDNIKLVCEEEISKDIKENNNNINDFFEGKTTKQFLLDCYSGIIQLKNNTNNNHLSEIEAKKLFLCIRLYLYMVYVKIKNKEINAILPDSSTYIGNIASIKNKIDEFTEN